MALLQARELAAGAACDVLWAREARGAVLRRARMARRARREWMAWRARRARARMARRAVLRRVQLLQARRMARRTHKL